MSILRHGKLLDRVGFDWDPIETNWRKRLKEFKERKSDMCCSKQYVSFILVGLYIDSCLFMFCTHEVIAEYSHIENFPTDYSDEVRGWIKRIRFSYKRQEKLMIKTSGPALTPKRLEELKALNFTWDPHEREFEGFF